MATWIHVGNGRYEWWDLKIYAALYPKKAKMLLDKDNLNRNVNQEKEAQHE